MPDNIAMEWNAQKYHDTCGRVTEQGAKLVDVLKGLSSCASVLDLGCGTGVLTNDIAGFVSEVIGIDSSPAMIEQAKASYPDIEFNVMDARALIWENRFDAVFSNAVFHFIKEQDALLGSVRKVLKKGGALVCEFGASGNLTGLLDAVGAACASRGKAYSLRFYYPAKDEYETLLGKNGFIVESIAIFDLDTQLREGAAGLRNWITQIFNVEMGWFNDAERSAVLDEIENALRPAQWDGANWHLPNRRIRVTARKNNTKR